MSYTSNHTPRCACGREWLPEQKAAGDVLEALQAMLEVFGMPDEWSHQSEADAANKARAAIATVCYGSGARP